jgi:hypothetical protein
MNLDDAQKKQVIEWIAAGLKLSEIQSKLVSEFGVRMTYLEVRLLMDDLKLVPKDREVTKPVELKGPPSGSPPTPPAEEEIEPEMDESTDLPGEEPTAAPAGNVSVTVDTLARPGAMISGGVTFSDGKSAKWYLDQYGRLGLAPDERGYRPPASDVQAFQMQLQAELQRMGYGG